MVRKSVIILLSLCATAACAAEIAESQKVEAQDVDYGEMYVLEKRTTVQNQWGAAINYSYGFSNPYFATHGANLTLSRNFGRYVFAGLAPSFYDTTGNDVPQKLTQELGAQGIETKLFHPKTAEYVIIGVTPLTGMLNWFSSKAVNFNLSLGAGVGGAQYSEIKKTLLSMRFFAMPEVMLTPHFGIQAGVQTSYDRFPVDKGNDWQNRVDVFGGVSTRF